ncbi:MAG: histidine kinase, partial [Marinobacter sp.]|nr:histidine kinase [Marinobacter sp.]
MESSDSAGFRTVVLWPGLWVPLALVTIGLLATGITANIEAKRAMALAETRYYAQHQALVNHLLANAPDPTTTSGQAGPPTAIWLQALFDNTLPESLGLRIDTLERHTKVPLLEIRASGSVDPTRALRTEVSPTNQSWMLTTLPAPAMLEDAARASRRAVWIAGAALSALVGLLTLLL